MRYTPYRGLPAVTAWVKLKFAAMNLKKLAIHKRLRLLFPPFYRIRSRIAGSQCGYFDKLVGRGASSPARCRASNLRFEPWQFCQRQNLKTPWVFSLPATPTSFC